MQRQWPEVVVKGRPLLGGGSSPLGASLPLLDVAVAWKHAKAVGNNFYQKVSFVMPEIVKHT
jgi:hypothetical protein